MDKTAAARIAARHGLSLADGSALSRMCDTEAEAEQVAAAFVTPGPGDPDAPAPTTTGEAFAEYFNAAIGTPSGADITDRIVNQEATPDA